MQQKNLDCHPEKGAGTILIGEIHEAILCGDSPVATKVECRSQR